MSNSIYSNKIHYTYKITEISTKKKYIGVRSCNRNPIDDLGKKYFSSSTNKEFIRNQKTNPSDYIYEILNVFDDRKDAINHEIQLHEEYDVSRNEMYYNKCKSKSDGFSTEGMIIAKDDDDNRLVVGIDDPRYLSGELVGHTKGYTFAMDADGNGYHVSKDDPRLKSGELFGNRKNRLTAYDVDGNKYDIDINDPRYISGELKPKKIEVFNATDKDGNRYVITKDDPRYISGELVHITKGTLLVRDTNNNLIRITKEEYNANKDIYTHIRSGMVTVKDQHGNMMTVSKNDPRYLSGELKSNMYGMSNYIDMDGNKYHLPTNDPRVVSGELISVNSNMIRAYENGGDSSKYKNLYKWDVRLKSGEYIPKNKKYYKDVYIDGVLTKKSIFID